MLSVVFFFKQHTAYEMRISAWSSDVCSSELVDLGDERFARFGQGHAPVPPVEQGDASAAFQFGHAPAHSGQRGLQIAGASCRERVCQYVSSSVVHVSCKQNKPDALHNPSTSDYIAHISLIAIRAPTHH